MKSEIRVVCFDIGGVLVQINHSWADACKDAGIDLSVADAAGSLDSFPEFALYQSGQVSESDFLKALAGHLGIGTDEAAKAHQFILKEFYPDVSDLIAKLQSQGIRVGCMSNTNDLHWIELFGSRFQEMNALDFKVASHLISSAKPDEAIYRYFEDLAECSPNEILFFDDGQANVDAAIRYGWHARRIDPHGQTARQIGSYLAEFGIEA